MRARLPILVATLGGVAALLFAPLCSPLPLLVYNPSASMPRGWYVIHVRSTYRIGDIVLAHLPPAAAALAAQRGYLSAEVPLLKRVAAVAPQKVCLRDGQVRVDGKQVAVTRPSDARGRRLPLPTFCGALRTQQVFLLSTDNADSFDGRYFGPTDRQAVLGFAEPLWTP